MALTVAQHQPPVPWVGALHRACIYCRRWAWAARGPRMRLLIIGRRQLSIHQGGRHSGNPSELIVQSQPRVAKLWW